jgi:23S rRNA pseudouridine1911/1915/1917 synthase
MTILNAPDLENEPFLVIAKPAGTPSAPPGPSLLQEAMALYPSIAEIAPVQGRNDFGLVHRLDTATSGLLVIALTQKAYDAFMAEQAAGRFVKEYTAVCEKSAGKPAGFPECPVIWKESGKNRECTVESRFRPWGPGAREVRPVTADSGPAAQKKATPRTYRTDFALRAPVTPTGTTACCRTTAGFRHQVRCHLAWLGWPVIGDPLYGTRGSTGGEMLFFATGLFFTVLDKNYTFQYTIHDA